MLILPFYSINFTHKYFIYIYTYIFQENSKSFSKNFSLFPFVVVIIIIRISFIFINLLHHTAALCTKCLSTYYCIVLYVGICIWKTLMARSLMEFSFNDFCKYWITATTNTTFSPCTTTENAVYKSKFFMMLLFCFILCIQHIHISYTYYMYGYAIEWMFNRLIQCSVRLFFRAIKH